MTESVMEVSISFFRSDQRWILLYLLAHPLSRSSFLPPCRLFSFDGTAHLNSPPLFQLLPTALANPRTHSLRILSFLCEFLLTVWQVLFLVGFVLLGVVTAVIARSGDARPNAGALPLVCLSRRVTDIVDRGLSMCQWLWAFKKCWWRKGQGL